MADDPPGRPPAASSTADATRRPRTGFDPRGVGSAWTHDFLNKKAWHPMSFKNRQKVWEAEQRAAAESTAKERRAQEYEAEREYLRTIAALGPEEQERYRQRQAVSWLYQKPPGFDAARAAAAEGKDANGAGGDDGQEPSHGDQQQQDGKKAEEQGQAGGSGGGATNRRSGGNYVAKVVGGVQAVVKSQQRFDLKQTAGGMSPPRGGIDPGAENQRLVVSTMDPEEEEAVCRLAMMTEEERGRLEKERVREERLKAKEARRAREAAERQRVREAVAFLKSAGIEVPGDSDSDSGSSSGSDSEEEEERRKRRRERKGKRRRSSKKRKKMKFTRSL